MNKIYQIICVFCATFFLTSCNDWLDVSPKSQIKEEDHFGREGGYTDQLTGIYTAMCSQDMYGLNMGIGFVEVLSHSYDIDGNGKWRYANEFTMPTFSLRTSKRLIPISSPAPTIMSIAARLTDFVDSSTSN